MRHIPTIFILFILMGCQSKEDSSESKPARLISLNFENPQFIGPKNYQVYLPENYDAENSERYPVLYMMDCQNLFFDSLSYSKHAWNINEIKDSLVNASAIKDFIIVGVDNAGLKRFAEYMPQKAVETLPENTKDELISMTGHPVFSDSFLLFLTQELKPRIDSTYRTLPDSANTFIGGSSMGGLISMYAQCEYPAVFGGALCLSTHWPVALDNSKNELPQSLIRYFAENVPKGKKWYFDFGTEGLDQYYEPHQLMIDSILMERGYEKNENWVTIKFPGHDHNEQSWHQRLHFPLAFAFGKK